MSSSSRQNTPLSQDRPSLPPRQGQSLLNGSITPRMPNMSVRMTSTAPERGGRNHVAVTTLLGSTGPFQPRSDVPARRPVPNLPSNVIMLDDLGQATRPRYRRNDSQRSLPPISSSILSPRPALGPATPPPYEPNVNLILRLPATTFSAIELAYRAQDHSLPPTGQAPMRFIMKPTPPPPQYPTPAQDLSLVLPRPPNPPNFFLPIYFCIPSVKFPFHSPLHDEAKYWHVKTSQFPENVWDHLLERVAGTGPVRCELHKEGVNLPCYLTFQGQRGTDGGFADDDVLEAVWYARNTGVGPRVRRFLSGIS